MKILKQKRGGKREGSGRPKKEPVKKINIRVPLTQLAQMQAAGIPVKSKSFVGAMETYINIQNAAR